MKKLLSVFILITIIYSCSKQSGSPVTAAGPYFPKVKSIIQANCMQCHDPSGTWQGRPTDLSTDDKIAQLAGTIKIAVAGPNTLTIHHMPQGGQLAQSDIDIIVAWNDKGGKVTD